MSSSRQASELLAEAAEGSSDEEDEDEDTLGSLVSVDNLSGSGSGIPRQRRGASRVDARIGGGGGSDGDSGFNADVNEDDYQDVDDGEDGEVDVDCCTCSRSCVDGIRRFFVCGVMVFIVVLLLNYLFPAVLFILIAGLVGLLNQSRWSCCPWGKRMGEEG